MEEPERRKKTKEKNIDEEIPSAPVLADFIQSSEDLKLIEIETKDHTKPAIRDESVNIETDSTSDDYKTIEAVVTDAGAVSSEPTVESENESPSVQAVNAVSDVSDDRSSYSDLNTNLHRMEPHLFLNKVN